jgi:hypothetical protein
MPRSYQVTPRHPRPATSDTAKGSQAPQGRQRESESARRRSRSLHPPSDITDATNQNSKPERSTGGQPPAALTSGSAHAALAVCTVPPAEMRSPTRRNRARGRELAKSESADTASRGKEALTRRAMHATHPLALGRAADLSNPDRIAVAQRGHAFARRIRLQREGVHAPTLSHLGLPAVGEHRAERAESGIDLARNIAAWRLDKDRGRTSCCGSCGEGCDDHGDSEHALHGIHGVHDSHDTPSPSASSPFGSPGGVGKSVAVVSVQFTTSL